MGTRIVISSSSHRRIARARAWLEARAPAEEVLIIGASLDAANSLARAVAQAKGAIFGWHRLTLAQIAVALAAPVLAALRTVPIGRLGVQAVATRVVHELAGRGALGRYSSIANGPGFARAIASVVTELRLAKLDPDALRTIAPDLLPLVQTYESQLAEGDLTDWAGVLTFAAEGAKSNTFAHPLVGLPTLLLDVSAASEAEATLIHRLCLRAPEVLATVPAADEMTLARFRDGLKSEVEDLDQLAAAELRLGTDGLGSLARLQRHLFKEPPNPTTSLPDDEVAIFSAPGESRECVEIARRVLHLAREGRAFDRMAVLLHSPEDYRGHLEEAFARAGVPAHFTRGAVRPDPTGRAFQALLRCGAEGLSAKRFAEYLSLGQVPEAKADGTPPEPASRGDRWVSPDPELDTSHLADLLPEPIATADRRDSGGAGDPGPVVAGRLRAPRRWEYLLVEAAVIGGRERWRRRIEGLRNDLRLKIPALADEDETRAAITRRTLEDLEAFAGYALPLIEALDGLPKSTNWGDWLDQLGALATRALRKPDRVLSMLSELAPMAGVGPVTLDEVLLVLSDLLLGVAEPPVAQRYGKVFVGPIEKARGLSFDTVFAPGLVEKLFPRKIVEEPILLDALRHQLKAGLPTNEDRLSHERLSLALAVGAAERQLHLSYPRLDLDEGRPRVPSFYALEVMRAAEGRLPDFAELARRAETATSSRVGWPAPEDPAAAIDDAEYDLATLNQLFSHAEQDAGSARYLVTANPHLARALRARYQRWSTSWTSADGLTGRSSTVRAIMAKHAFAARSYSPTALQNYAACPYRFFLQAVHRLAPREVPETIDALDPLQRGSLIHDIQFELFGRLRDRTLLPVRPKALDEIRLILGTVIEETAARYHDDLAPAIERIWQDGIAVVRADLSEWLRRASEDESGFIPWHFEMSFGLQHREDRQHADPQSVPGPVGLDSGLHIRGSIDLVERHPSGIVRVTDHKSGKPEGKPGQVVDGGKSLQPVLYALVAEKLFGAENKVESGRLYFCTSVGGFTEHVVPLDASARNSALVVTETVGDAIAQPFLPASPAAGECAWCDYRIVCGPDEERRTARKPKGSVEPLLRLRGMP